MPPANHPATADAPRDLLLALADRCVQCGLCLPVCPTYALERTEAESPRGRIAVVRAWELRTIAPTDTADSHLDHCLGCRGCEAVCPAGVDYGQLLTVARSRQRDRLGRTLRQAAIEWLAARPRALTAALGLYRWLFPALPAGLRPLPRPPARDRHLSPARPTVETAALFMGCVARAYEGDLRDAVSALCAAVGTAVLPARGQTCCGALHAHGGDSTTSRRLAQANRQAFSAGGTVLTMASGCHEALGQALAGIATTTDAITFLHERADRLRFLPHRERVALHLPCTQRNVVKSTAALRGLLARVPGLEVVELTAGYGCCGAAGTQMLLDASRAASYRQPLMDEFERSGATRLLSANIGCRLHLANGAAKPVQHPLELLAECLAGIPASSGP